VETRLEVLEFRQRFREGILTVFSSERVISARGLFKKSHLSNFSHKNTPSLIIPLQSFVINYII